MTARKLLRWFSERVSNYNLFLPNENDYEDDDAMGEPVDPATVSKQQRYATRLYVFLLIISFYMMVLFALLNPENRLVTMEDITPALFERLQLEYGDSLSCPCSSITISYNTFVSTTQSLDPICSSFFVTSQWIEALDDPNASAYLVAEFRKTARSQFELLAAFCSIYAKMISEVLADIDHQQLVSVQLLRQEDFRSQVNTSIQLIQSTARTRASSLVDFVQTTSRSNSLVSSLMTNVVLGKRSGFQDHGLLSMALTFYYKKNFDVSTVFSRSCSDVGFVTPAAFYSSPIATLMHRLFWPEAPIANVIIPDAMVNGFFGGCTPLDALMASTLECLYQTTCLQTWRWYFPGLNQTTIDWSNLALSSPWPNVSLGDRFAQLLIKQEPTELNYTNYFKQCAALFCTYTVTNRINFSNLLALLLSIYGGLTALLRLAAPLIVILVAKLKHRPLNIVANGAGFTTSVATWIRWLKRLNVFKSAADRTEEAVRQQRITTRVFLILLGVFTLIFALFTSLKPEIRIVNVPNSSFITYQELNASHSDTLKCPCSTMAMPYREFAELSPTFHHVCSSHFASQSWIGMFSTVATDTISDQWYYGAHRFFRLLVIICDLANRTADNEMQQFMAQTIVTAHVLTKGDFIAQINTTVTHLTQSIVRNFNFFISAMRFFNQVDQPLVLAASIRLIRRDSEPSQFTFQLHGINSSKSTSHQCICATEIDCQGPFVLGQGAIIFPAVNLSNPTAHLNEYVMPGMMRGCSTLESALRSSLECLYSDKICLPMIFAYIKRNWRPLYGELPTSKFHALVYNRTSSRYTPGTLLSEIVQEMMIERWNPLYSFDNYYNTCAPIYCTYSQTTRSKNFIGVMITLVSMIGGLTAVLRFVVPQFVSFFFRLLKPKVKQPQTGAVRQPAAKRLKVMLHSLMALLRNMWMNLNMFPARAFPSNLSRTTAKHLGIWATRMYIVLLTAVFLILTLYMAVEPQMIKTTIATPTRSTYDRLMTAHSTTLQCPCSNISSSHDHFVFIEPIFHPVCLSPFATDDWRKNMTAGLVRDLSAYGTGDYRRFLSAHLQFLSALCQISRQSVNYSVEQLLTSQFITNELLSLVDFEARVNSTIDRSRSTAPAMLNHLLFMLRATSHGNAIISMYGTNYDLFADVKDLYPHSIVYAGNCSCRLNATCSTQASFSRTESSNPVIIKGLRMGCTPTESFFASTLECFYDPSCLRLLQEMTHVSNGTNTPDPLTIDHTRFSINTTVADLMADLFTDSWLTKPNYTLYFDRCAPIFCSFTYSQKVNSLDTITYLLGLYGGLTIVLTWICPTVISVGYGIYQRRKRQSSRVALSNDINIAIVKTAGNAPVSVINQDNTTLTPATRFSSALLSCLAFGFVLAFIATFIAITMMYLRQKK